MLWTTAKGCIGALPIGNDRLDRTVRFDSYERVQEWGVGDPGEMEIDGYRGDTLMGGDWTRPLSRAHDGRISKDSPIPPVALLTGWTSFGATRDGNRRTTEPVHWLPLPRR